MRVEILGSTPKKKITRKKRKQIQQQTVFHVFNMSNSNKMVGFDRFLAWAEVFDLNSFSDICFKSTNSNFFNLSPSSRVHKNGSWGSFEEWTYFIQIKRDANISHQLYIKMIEINMAASRRKVDERWIEIKKRPMIKANSHLSHIHNASYAMLHHMNNLQLFN